MFRRLAQRCATTKPYLRRAGCRTVKGISRRDDDDISGCRMDEDKQGSADSAVVDLTQSDNSDDVQSIGSENSEGKRDFKRSAAAAAAADLKGRWERDVTYSSLHSVGKITNASWISQGTSPSMWMLCWRAAPWGPKRSSLSYNRTLSRA